MPNRKCGVWAIFISVPVPIFWAVLKRKRTTQELTRGYNVTVNEGTMRG